jgi:two-component system phosphate regulon sensor histidine kinase PhoR
MPLRPILATAAWLTLPFGLTLAALVMLGQLDGWTAFLALLASAAAVGALLRFHLGGVVRITAHLDAIAEGEERITPSPAWPPLAAALASAVARVKRRWQQRRDELMRRIAALDAVLDSLPDPFIMLDSRLRVVRANSAANELLTENPLGRDLSASFRVPAILEAAQSALRHGIGSRVEFELTSPVKRSFVGRVERLAGMTSDEFSLIVVLHDLTAEKRTEQMRADFVANASHELRTPLATLLGFIETLQGPASQDARARERFLAIMQYQAGRMSRLVDDLLSLSRIELREHTPPTERVDLLQVLRGVADALQPQSKARQMTVAIEHTNGALPPVLGDPDELAQVFQNLIDNALKYGRRGTTIEIFAFKADHCPVPISRVPAAGLAGVAVRDRGEGITSEQIPRLTERFYRVDAARSRELGGTGLGLAIVKHIVNRHRGALQIESEIGQGSTFTVYLPITRDTRRAEE